MRGRGGGYRALTRRALPPLTASLVALGVLFGVNVGVGSAAEPVATEFSAGISGTPMSIAPGPDGNLWFTEQSPKAIGRITPSGNVTEFSAGITANPHGITAAADGNLWFAEPGPGLPDKIGRITPSGDVTEFPTGTSGALAGIAAGPDGNVWFIAGGIVGRITPSGVVDQPGAGITCSHLTGITAGPDGNMWFAGCQEVGRVTPSGQVTEYPVGSSPYESPSAIVSGPDGNLWFAEGGAAGGGYGPKIGRITTAGVVTHFSFAGQVWGLTAGPDGNLWFTNTLADSIGRFTLAGRVGYVSAGITPGSWPAAITAGPDGNLWFTETVGRRIGRMTPGEPPEPPLPSSPPPPSPPTGRSGSNLMSPLAVTMARPGTMQRGGRAKLTFRIRNGSDAPVSGIVLKCTLPAGFVVDSISRAANRRVRRGALRFTAKGRVLTFKLGTIASQRGATVGVNAKVKASAAKGRRIILFRVWGRGVRPWLTSAPITVR